MLIDKVKELLLSWNPSKPPLFLWGPPGIGKSEVVKQVATERSIGLREIYLTQVEPTDVRGILWVKGNEATWLPPNVLPRSGEGILFLDELPAALPAVQNAVHQLVCFRSIGEYRLPDGWFIVAAGNKEEDGAECFLSAPMANRFCHLEVKTSFAAWRKWAIKTEVNPAILAFLEKFPHRLLGKPTDGPFPSPRSWTMLSRTGVFDAEVIKGCIGEVAQEFLAFKKNAGKFEKALKDLEKKQKPNLEIDQMVCLNYFIIYSKLDADKICHYLVECEPEIGVHLLVLLNESGKRKWFDERYYEQLHQKYDKFEG